MNKEFTYELLIKRKFRKYYVRDYTDEVYITDKTTANQMGGATRQKATFIS